MQFSQPDGAFCRFSRGTHRLVRLCRLEHNITNANTGLSGSATAASRKELGHRTGNARHALSVQTSTRFNGNIVRVGLNYQFH
jgi:hypothetical protein